jgi:hypothetical protein
VDDAAQRAPCTFEERRVSCSLIESSVAVQVRPGDRWISRIAAATVAGLAGVAGALSYSHMRQLAQDHGQAGWHAHAFPLSVDGIEIVTSLVLLADRRAGRRSGWLPWTALALGTAGSFAANIATAHPDLVSRIIAGWPAVALLIAVKLLSGILEHRAARVSSSAAVDGATTVMPEPVPRPARRVMAEQASAVSAPASDAGDLLAAARAARDELSRRGRPLTRDALAVLLRQRGHPVRNERVTVLLRHLRNEDPHDHQPITAELPAA